jgi:CheY-like chemotaxis protein
VQIAENGKDAVTAVEAADYDLVLMDCQMPEMDGFAATRAIRNLDRGRQLPIIAMTANAMAEDRQICLEAGMDDYLAKPISTEQLYNLVERVKSGGGRAVPAPENAIEPTDRAGSETSRSCP